jgi:hypothetical protein
MGSENDLENSSFHRFTNSSHEALSQMTTAAYFAVRDFLTLVFVQLLREPRHARQTIESCAYFSPLVNMLVLHDAAAS